MTVEASTVWLVDGASGDAVEAQLLDAIGDAQLIDWQTKWQPELFALL